MRQIFDFHLLSSFSDSEIGVDPRTRFFEAAFFSFSSFLSFLLAFLLRRDFLNLRLGVQGDLPWRRKEIHHLIKVSRES